jgi:hypothetical protein
MQKADQFVAVGIKLTDENKRVPGERPKAELHQTLDFAVKACKRMYYDEGSKMTFPAVAVKCIFNKETKEWELPDGFTTD